MIRPTPIRVDVHRSRIYAATSICGKWAYLSKGALCEITHAPTRRRYWTNGLEQARRETADGTAARRLETWRTSPPPGKPMTDGEHHAIMDELSRVDCERMLAAIYTDAGMLVEAAVHRIRPNTAPDALLTSRTVSQILGVLYGHAPDLWLSALRTRRPELVPPHLNQPKG